VHGLTRATLRFAAVGVLAAISAAGLGAAPATAATGEVMVAGAVLGQGLYFDWQTDGTSGWNEEPVASGSFDPPAVSVQSDGNVLISAVDTGNGALYFFWQQYGTSTCAAGQGWSPARAIARVSGTPSMSRLVIVAARAPRVPSDRSLSAMENTTP
jgi:hypothetical protein